ncbi:glycoside hydrolase family 12 [Microbulbifer sp. A4B17]|uniref:GH12 family glycosyl hydrolase domain-containing protein n=1 Tax=Microbulbifer sp. A4B17 TaxID=359370 RepID=UPI000D52B159|nr:glycoside hydrolase family 12 [Microbulbifer sp. A4B17]AWF82276.1 glycoside hydrolase family 12 [Microbulbifer sp. A4B17]
MRFFLAFSIALASFSVSVNKGIEWIKPETITISCKDYYSVPTKFGVLSNNVWNKHAAKDDPWSQCLEKRHVDGELQFGWSWSWPYGREVIYAQPQIKVGSSPWAPEPKFDDSFPLKISSLTELDIFHHTESMSNGNHNTTTTMWLISEAYRGGEQNRSVIAAEIMIWTYFTEGHFSPAGRKRGELSINGTVWEIWYDKNWKDMSGINDNNWVYISFKAKQPSVKVSIPGLKLLKFAIQDGLISKDWYIADVELGNEVMSGSGVTWVKDFAVNYNIGKK